MPYFINEGRFEVDALEDRSVNMVSLPAQEGGGALTLVITRDALKAGEDLKAGIARQLKVLARQVQDFAELSREGGWLGAGDSSSALAIVLYTRFRQQGQTWFQAQCVAQCSGQELLILTLTHPHAFDEALRQRWKALLAGFTPTPRLTPR
jgi:hypothetical protein